MVVIIVHDHFICLRFMTILCIDDEEPGLELRKRLLEKAGYRVLTALSGPEGIHICKSQGVDAAIIDYWMAGMNGVKAAQEIKQLNPHTPIIILSGFVPLPDEFTGIAEMWIQKAGMSPDDLLLSVDRLLKKHSLKAAKAQA